MISKPIPMFEDLFPENTLLVMLGPAHEKDGKLFFDVELVIDPLFKRIFDAVNRVFESHINEDEK